MLIYLWCNPSLFKSIVNDGALDFLDCHWLCIDSQYTSALEQLTGEKVILKITDCL